MLIWPKIKCVKKTYFLPYFAINFFMMQLSLSDEIFMGYSHINEELIVQFSVFFIQSFLRYWALKIGQNVISVIFKILYKKK